MHKPHVNIDTGIETIRVRNGLSNKSEAIRQTIMHGTDNSRFLNIIDH